MLRPESLIYGRQPRVSKGGDDGALPGATLAIQSCCVPALGAGRTPAEANRVKSLYTTMELKACKQVKPAP